MPKRLFSLFAEMSSLPEIDVILARPDHKKYITKNRRWQGPEREKWLRDLLGLHWQKGSSFKGKRWNWSSDAKAILDLMSRNLAYDGNG